MNARWIPVALAAACVPARADVPTYGTIELQAREGATTNYNLPADAGITATTSVSINDAARVALRIFRDGDDWTRHLFVAQGGVGGIVYSFPDTTALMGDAAIGPGGAVAFDVSQTAANNGPWRWDPQTQNATRVSTQPLGTQLWEFSQLNTAGNLASRVGFGSGRAWVSYAGATATVHATESAIDGASPYSFLFTPVLNDARDIAGRVRLGPANAVADTQPDRVVAIGVDGSTRVLARDRDDDPTSPWFAMDNGIGFNNAGEVAFIARLGPAGSPRAVVATDGVQARQVAVTGGGAFTDIEFFAPDINDAGKVLFRARDAGCVQGLFVGDGTRVVPVVRRGDVVPTDEGPRRIGRPNASEAAFGGRPALSASGDVAFIADLMTVADPPVLVGRGVFVAYAGPGDGLFADGFEAGPPPD